MSPDDIFRALQQTCAAKTESQFKQFIERAPSTKWIIAADFAIEDRTRFNDVLVYTVFPYNQTLDETKREISSVAASDLKHVREVSEPMLRYLASGKHYSFVFLLSRTRKFFPTKASATAALDELIWTGPERGLDAETIKRIKVFRNSGNLNPKLLGNIPIASSFAAFVAHLLLKLTPVEVISWMPDRDSMTNYGDSIARDFFGLSFYAFSRHHEAYSRLKILVGKETRDGKMWFDELVRVSDYLAGTIAAWDMEEHRIIGDQPKFVQVLSKGVANNPYVAVINVTLTDAEIRTHATDIRLNESE